MRLRFGIALCFFALLWAVGCRKPLTPSIDRNVAPETWIVAAPMDTITVRDANHVPVPGDPTVHVIPVRFHMYWAGSDPDGAVVGFYWAVTETTTTIDPLTGTVPPLPGPKPLDYHYTTRTDTTFIFNVTENSPDRQHAFFIYAVDNMGKADPTPARFMFTSIDKYPPTPIFDVAQALGTIYTYDAPGGVSYACGQLQGGQLNSHPVVKDITDQSVPRTLPRDTAAVNSGLRFKWHAVLGIAGTFVLKYCHKLEEPDFVCTPPAVDSATYAGGLAAGQKVFTLRAVDQAGGARDSTRRFILNFDPDTWFSGPDTLAFPNQIRDPATGDRWYQPLPSPNGPGVPCTLMSPDSITVLPLYRQPRKTFFEIYNGKLYAHAEFDTVHMNSFVIFFNGGYDKDSKYSVRIDSTDRNYPPGNVPHPVLIPGPANGSPVGFHTQVVLDTDPSGSHTDFAQSVGYPVFDPASVFYAAAIGGYWPMYFSGKAYAVGRAEDGDAFLDNDVPDARGLAKLVDGGGGTPEERLARQRKVMVFYVNKSPFLLTSNPTFSPLPNGSTQFVTSDWTQGLNPINLPADDTDPLDPTVRTAPGGPSEHKILRYKLTVLGSSFFTGRDTTFEYNPQTPTSPYYFASPTPPAGFVVPCWLAGGPVTLRVQLCDCIQCELNNGEGRCVTYDLPATYVRPSQACP